MAPWLAALAPAAVQGGLGLLTQRSAKNQREKERREAEKRAAFAKLVDSLGGQGRDTGRQAGAAAGSTNPLLGAATGLAADPLVREQITKLMEQLLSGAGGLLSRLPGGRPPSPNLNLSALSGMTPPSYKGFGG
jgi:hypothetical protein